MSGRAEGRSDVPAVRPVRPVRLRWSTVPDARYAIQQYSLYSSDVPAVRPVRLRWSTVPDARDRMR